MIDSILVVGLVGEADGVLAGLGGALRQAGAEPQAAAIGGAPAGTLVTLTAESGAAIAAAVRFAAETGEADRLVVLVLPSGPAGDWIAAREAAVLWAFTRHAALAWAPRGVRVNALALGAVPVLAGQIAETGRPAAAVAAAAATVEDAAAAILAMRRWRSMTGQLIRLGA
jgi:hypothetical protein